MGLAWVVRPCGGQAEARYRLRKRGGVQIAGPTIALGSRSEQCKCTTRFGSVVQGIRPVFVEVGSRRVAPSGSDLNSDAGVPIFSARRNPLPPSPAPSPSCLSTDMGAVLRLSWPAHRAAACPFLMSH